MGKRGSRGREENRGEVRGERGKRGGGDGKEIGREWEVVEVRGESGRERK